MNDWKLNLPAVVTRGDILFPPREYRHSWTYRELIGIFPDRPLRILDVGAGSVPFRARNGDELITADFDDSTSPTELVDVAKSWPFGPEEFDFIYMSHVVEHFYPEARDAVIRNVYTSLRPGGLVFIRVPHWSGIQGEGWEHYTRYALNGATSLSHGRNPLLPMFRSVSVGVATTIDFDRQRSRQSATMEAILNRRWRLTEAVLCHLVGGIAEVQYLLQRMDAAAEARLREGGSL